MKAEGDMNGMAKAVVIGLTAVVLAGTYARVHGHSAPPRFQTSLASMGDVVRRVAATGTLEAVTSAEVGSQVSGTISALGADFNSIVRKGEVIARIDPSLVDAQIQSARSALAKASADADGAVVAVGDADVKLKQAVALHDRQLIPDADYDAAKIALETANANLESARAQEAEARAALDQALVDRTHTVITAPIDGIVISRNVDVGQTVAASFQAPTLFVIAGDLTRMQLNAGIDESDIGMVHQGQRVTFAVDAYPQDEFVGRVRQVRLQPVVSQNVVTYSTLIDVDNRDLRLKPGMTATLNVEVARSRAVLRVPMAALKYVPRKDVFAALGEAVPAELAEEASRRSPGSAPGARAIVWAYDDAGLRPVRVTTGLSDGGLVAVSGPALRSDMPVVTGELVAPITAASGSPLNPMPRVGR
jgi:HlyD family secretion protein